MIDVDSFVNLRDVENGLRRLQLAGMDLRPVFKASRKAMRADVRDHAKKKQSSAGTWPALARSTLEHRKQRKGKQGRPRKRPVRGNPRPLGRLPNANKLEYTARSIKMISRVPWSGVHNDPNGGRAGHGSRIPGREYMWASSGFLAIVARNAVDHMLTSWDRSGR